MRDKTRKKVRETPTEQLKFCWSLFLLGIVWVHLTENYNIYIILKLEYVNNK